MKTHVLGDTGQLSQSALSAPPTNAQLPNERKLVSTFISIRSHTLFFPAVKSQFNISRAHNLNDMNLFHNKTMIDDKSSPLKRIEGENQAKSNLDAEDE